MRRVPIADLGSGGAALRELAALVRSGGVLAIPTESSYGLAVAPRSEEGVRRVFALKGRDADKALPVLLADLEQLKPLGVVTPAAMRERFAALWPAPLTVVMPIEAPIAASGGSATLAVRVPAHAGLRAILRETGPLTATSLNRSGHPPCLDPEEAAREFGAEIDVLVDGGIAPGGPPSTLVDASVDPARVLRRGAFPWPPAAP